MAADLGHFVSCSKAGRARWAWGAAHAHPGRGARKGKVVPQAAPRGIDPIEARKSATASRALCSVDGDANHYAFPLIGSLSVAAIETAHVCKILEPIWTRKAETPRLCVDALNGCSIGQRRAAFAAAIIPRAGVATSISCYRRGPRCRGSSIIPLCHAGMCRHS